MLTLLDRTYTSVVTYLLQAKVEVGKLIAKAQINDLEPEAGCTMMETFERNVNMALNKARDDAGKAAQISLQETNNVVRMVQAGSKGSFINISQVIYVIGSWLAHRAFQACIHKPHSCRFGQ